MSLRIGIVGAGKMALQHVQAARRTARAEVVGVADPSPTAREAAAAAFPDLPVFESLAEMVEAVAPHAVHIVSPPATHVSLARQALDAGLHIYVEKPFAESATEAEELFRIASQRSLKIAAGHQLLYEPPTRIIEHYLPWVSPVVHVESYFSFRPVRHVAGRTPLRADLQLLDILPHPVYLLLRMLDAGSSGGTTRIRAIEVSSVGTVHAIITRGSVAGSLVVTLEGRPVESYLRVVGRNGLLLGDYVRGTVRRSIGPGWSGIDKVIAPYREGRQILTGTTRALTRRLVRRQRSYPGLAELLTAFYDSILQGGPPPISPESIIDTVRICQAVAEELARVTNRVERAPARPMNGRGVLVTGGTGFLGRALVKELVGAGNPVRVLARREPAPWERIAEAEYVTADLAAGVSPPILQGIETVIHCAAETAGGWKEHQRNSIEATEQLIGAAAANGIRRFVQVSSLAVLATNGGRPISDISPLEPASRGSGPYVWGKLESERRAAELGASLGVDVKIVRPGALIDYQALEPPGKLGKRIGNVFVAVGGPGQRMGTTELQFAANYLTWMMGAWEEAPAVINLLDPDLPTKRSLLQRLRQTNPDLRVVWVPTLLLVPLSGAAWVLQKVLRPRRPAISVAKVFKTRRYDTASSREAAKRMERREN